MNLNKYIFIIVLTGILLLQGSCVPTDSGEYDESEIIRCSITAQYNSQNGVFKTEATFHIVDSLGNERPYFLEKPPTINGYEIEKSFVQGKGIFYPFRSPDFTEKTAVFSFHDFNDEIRNVKIPICAPTAPDCPITKSGDVKISAQDCGAAGTSKLLCLDKEEKLKVLQASPEGIIQKEKLETLQIGKGRFISVWESKASNVNRRVKMIVEYEGLSTALECDITE